MDKDYYIWLQHRRNIQRVSGKYRTVWNHQEGKCYFCDSPMLSDQDVEIIEKKIGQGRSIQNMAYVHKKCAMDTFSISDAKELTHLDILSRLERYVESTPEEDSPYLELREYFRLSDKTPISLSFHDIERIQGDKLDWEAYFYNACWYDDTPDKSSMLWQEEDFPFHMFRFTTIGYNISESWLSQGYRIKALYVNERRIVFRRVLQEVSGLRLPKTLFRKKYPRKAAYEWEQFCSYFVKKWG